MHALSMHTAISKRTLATTLTVAAVTLLGLLATTADALADKLPDARLDRLETLGHAQAQVKESVIDGAHGDAQAPAVLNGAGLRIAGHGSEDFARGLEVLSRRSHLGS